jgi:DMSO/TMAO reductase YedYZ molybdopterin-dependent catalytic subunit
MKNRKLIIVIAFLAALTIILGYLNMRNVDTTANEAGSIAFISGESIIELSFDEITALEHHEFKATEDTSSSGPASRKYKGVLLKDVLNKASINNESIAASSKIIIKGLDGYVIAMSTDEVLSDKSVYLAFEKNGKPLGNMKNGGSGPFQLIAISDSFSQRWCKYVFEVSLE